MGDREEGERQRERNRRGRGVGGGTSERGKNDVNEIVHRILSRNFRNGYGRNEQIDAQRTRGYKES